MERKERIEGMGTLHNILPSVVADHPFSFLAARRRHPVRSFSPLFLSGMLKKGHGASVLPSVLPTVDHPTPPQNSPPTPTILLLISMRAFLYGISYGVGEEGRPVCHSMIRSLCPLEPRSAGTFGPYLRSRRKMGRNKGK